MGGPLSPTGGGCNLIVRTLSGHKNVSEFLLDAGVIAANQALADRRRFVLDDEKWEAFRQALDRPVQARPRLKKLLDESGILD